MLDSHTLKASVFISVPGYTGDRNAIFR